MRGGASESKALDLASHRSVGSHRCFSRFSCRECTKRVPPSGDDKTLAMLLSRRSLIPSAPGHLYHTDVLSQLKKFRTHAQSQSTQLMVNEIDFQNGFH